jgi:glycosyltransferase involved in cell wall biosynthesis
MIPLSVTIITRNEAHNIVRCLESVKPIASEIVVIDSISDDNTVQICKDHGCKTILKAFDGYGNQKQFAVDQASGNWILSIDADEEVSPALQTEIRNLLSQSGPLSDGYYIPRTLNFMGREMKHSGVGQELILRLFDRRKGAFTKLPVHESIEIQGTAGTLRGRIIHYSYRDISHHIEKLNDYTTKAAQGYQAHGKRFSKTWVALKFPVSFFIFYFVKRGFLDGYPGFMWSLLAAVYASLKIAKTIELNERS